MECMCFDYNQGASEELWISLLHPTILTHWQTAQSFFFKSRSLPIKQNSHTNPLNNGGSSTVKHQRLLLAAFNSKKEEKLFCHDMDIKFSHLVWILFNNTDTVYGLFAIWLAPVEEKCILFTSAELLLDIIITMLF